MKVIKAGVIPTNDITFNCSYCGCIFIATDKEYVDVSDYREIAYECVCPTCGRKVYGKHKAVMR